MKRVTQKTSQGKKYHWVCSDHVMDKTTCSMKREREENIKNAFATMLNKLLYAKDIILMPKVRVSSLATTLPVQTDQLKLTKLILPPSTSPAILPSAEQA